MRYGNPSTKSVVQEMVNAGCQKILFFPLYPHYAGPTSATANDAFFRSLMRQTWQPAARTVTPYFDRPDYIDALATSIEKAYSEAKIRPEVLLCSYHGVPKTVFNTRRSLPLPMPKNHSSFTRTLRLGPNRIATTFQSKFGPEEWLQPYTVKEVARMRSRGKKKHCGLRTRFFIRLY